MVFERLEIAAVLRAFPSSDRYREICDHPTLATQEKMAFHAIREAASPLDLRSHASVRKAVSAENIRRTRTWLTGACVPERSDTAATTGTDLERRSCGEGDLKIPAAGLGYDRGELTGDQDPRAATEADRMSEDA
ncbi:hypothetical protein [Sabulicella glaciei]|uniref:Uncharacterized protein n=1 Tax=Sabulicella glaciei TaxID=2984948 RepID=A0ABT3P2L8_9PROT|nr:hypothetical protein [Roseococcus sp. MDT2-1-1]MCW8088433.1 hypothetical protein [Roseococcus sp. MDT2-1-1]